MACVRRRPRLCGFKIVWRADCTCRASITGFTGRSPTRTRTEPELLVPFCLSTRTRYHSGNICIFLLLFSSLILFAVLN
jgi:hypothetical protein